MRPQRARHLRPETVSRDPVRPTQLRPEPAARRRPERGPAWEDAIISLEPNGTRDNYRNRPDAAAAFVRICAHYFGNGAFLDDGRLEGIPALLLHGRHDLGGPVKTAWDLARAWPGAEPVIIEDSGHTGSPTFVAEARSGIDRLTASL